MTSEEPNGRSPPPAASAANWLKLFLLPAAVVSVVIVVAMSLGWLGGSSRDAESLVSTLEREGAGRWPAAVNLASLLSGPDGDAIKRDPALARRLAEVLRREVRDGGPREEQIALQIYLCRALGEFHRIEVLPALAEAARTERDPREADVRRSAVEAIAVLAGNLGPEAVRADPAALDALLRAAGDPRPEVRATTAFTLGVVGGPQAQQRLERLLADARPEVRYNAATGLARQGNPACVEVLLEMLRPDSPAGEVKTTPPAGVQPEPVSVWLNALRAVRLLAKAEPSAISARVAGAVRELARSGVDPAVRSAAEEVLAELRPAAGD